MYACVYVYLSCVIYEERSNSNYNCVSNEACTLECIECVLNYT